MPARSILVASLLAAGSVSASILPARLSARQNIPASCGRVGAIVEACVPGDAVTEDEFTTPAIVSCVCSDGSFDDDIVDCITNGASFLTPEIEAALESFNGYCSLYAGGGGSGPVPTPTPTPTGTGSGVTDSDYCNYFLDGIDQCWTDNNPLPTAAPVASCLCSESSFDIAVEGCYSDIVATNPDGAATVAAFAGFCSSWSAMGDSPATPTGRATRTPVDDDNVPTQTPSTNDDDVDTNAPGTTRVIQTLNPQSTNSGNNNNGGNNNGNNSNGGNNGNNGNTGNNSNGGNSPNSAVGVKMTVFGTSLAVLVASVALML